jgi:hypothetical protein
MLEEKDLAEVRAYVIRILPQLLQQEPEVAATIEGILAQHFPRRDEFARLLDELTQTRVEVKQGFEQVDRRFEQVDQRFEQVEQTQQSLRQEMNQRFEQVDQRFEQVDQRFEQVDQRFEQVDQRFEQVDQRFEQVDQRFEQVDQRFEQVDQRFEQMDQRFGQVDQRFGQVDQRFEQMHETQLSMKQDIVQLRHGQETLLRRYDGQEKWMRLAVGQLSQEKGHDLEDIFAAALQYGLKNPDIQPEHIRLRQPLVDPDGQVFWPGYKSEVDLIAQDDQLTVFEVKATAKPGDVEIFARKVRLLASQHPEKQVRGVFISLAAPPEVRQRCEEFGLQLLD